MVFWPISLGNGKQDKKGKVSGRRFVLEEKYSEEKDAGDQTNVLAAKEEKSPAWLPSPSP